LNNHQIQQDKLIRVLIVDDHPLFRRGVHNLLEAEEDLQPTGEVGSIPEAQEWLSDHTADVALLDHNLPGINGISGLPRLLEIQTDLQVIVLTVGDNNEDFRQAIRVGACGYLLKDAAPEKLLEAVRMAANHECRISKRMMHTLFQSGSGKFRQSGNGNSCTAFARDSATRRLPETWGCLQIRCGIICSGYRSASRYETVYNLLYWRRTAAMSNRRLANGADLSC